MNQDIEDYDSVLQTLAQNADYVGIDSILSTLDAGQISALSSDTLAAFDAAGVRLLTMGDDFLFNSGSSSSVYGLDGNDSIHGGANDTYLFGGAGDDYVNDNRGGNNILHGGDGEDSLNAGDGDDIYYGGDGADTLTSRGGADTFVFRQGDTGVDIILNMNTQEGDRLDLSNLLTGYNPLSDNIHFFVKLTELGGTTTVSIDADGQGSGGNVDIAILQARAGFSVEELIVPIPSSNNAPDAVDDSVSTTENTALVVNVLANDSDADEDPLTVTQTGTAQHGGVVINTDGTITYTPDAGFTGTDSFDYTISDGQGATDFAVVSVTVEADGGDYDSDLQSLAQNADYVGIDSILSTLDAGQISALSSDTLAAFDAAGVRLLTMGDDDRPNDYRLEYEEYGLAGTSSGSGSIHGLGGNDTIQGGAKENFLFGGAGDDNLYGYHDARGRDDVLYGGAGADFLDAGVGNDTLYGGNGADILTGGDGSDTFVFRQGDMGVDRVYIFSTQEGDRLDVSDLLPSYNSSSDAISDFLQITDDGVSTIVSVDADGGADDFTQIAILVGVKGLTDEADLEASGNLVTV